METTYKYEVEITVSEKLTIAQMHEMERNIGLALVNCKENVGLTPDDSEAVTICIYVTPSGDNFD